MAIITGLDYIIWRAYATKGASKRWRELLPEVYCNNNFNQTLICAADKSNTIRFMCTFVRLAFWAKAWQQQPTSVNIKIKRKLLLHFG